MTNKLIKLSGGDSALIITPTQKKALGLNEDYNYQINKLSKDKWELIKISATDKKEQTLIDKLENMTFHDRVAGNLEKKLSAKEYQALLILLKTGEIIKFKGGEKYKKHVFVTKQEYDRLTNKKEEGIKTTSDNSETQFKNNGFAIIKNAKTAYEFSRKHYSEFQKGIAVGIKSFTGYYYVIKKAEFQNNYSKVIDALNREKHTIRAIAKYIGKEEGLTECLLAIMQDKGLIYEEKRDKFKLIN